MTALLLGSLSTLCDTSELQREAFNAAFAVHGLDWRWDREQYVGLLHLSGGAQRIADQAARLGQDVDARAVHVTKSELFQARLEQGGLAPRDGVVDTVRQAREAGLRVALVTTTSPANVSALLKGLEAHPDAADLDLVVDASLVDRGKPDPAAYLFALAQLAERPGHCVAVEDNVPGLQAALGAGIACVAFPNQNTLDHDFGAAADVVTHLELTDLLTHVEA